LKIFTIYFLIKKVNHNQLLTLFTPTSSSWDSIRKISLVREKEIPLGLSIVGGKLASFFDSDTKSDVFISGVFITQISEKSLAGLNGNFETGDRILKVNEYDLTTFLSHDEAVTIINNAESPITFVIHDIRYNFITNTCQRNIFSLYLTLVSIKISFFSSSSYCKYGFE
jgi:hypothetical protein